MFTAFVTERTGSNAETTPTNSLASVEGWGWRIQKARIYEDGL